MPRFEDKRKPVNIYADGSASRKVQDKMNASVGNTVQGLANIADTYFGGSGARQLGRGLQALAKPITDPLVAGRRRQENYFRNKEINAMPPAIATPQNLHGKTSYTQPVKKQPVKKQSFETLRNLIPQKVVNNSFVKETHNTQRDNELGKMSILSEITPEGQEKRTFNIGGNTLSYNVAKEKNSPEIAQTNLEQNLKRKYKLGNLDVQFDSSVDQAAQKRFLEDPIRPTAQIDRYAQRPKLMRLMNNDKVSLYTKENSPDMDYRERRILNLQLLKNKQAATNTQKNIQSAQIINKNNTMRAAERNKILADQNLRNQNLENQKLQILTKRQLQKNNIAQSKIVDIDDGLGGTKKVIFNQRGDGTWYNAMPKKQLSQGHPALALLRKNIKNPLYTQKFKETYGYLPSWANIK